MSRYLYITAGVLLILAAISFGMTFAVDAYQPGLPAGGSLWKTTSLFLVVGALISSFFAVLRAMFEQVARRNEARRGVGTVIEFPGKAGRGQEKYSPRDGSARGK
ncbi:MAG TPA: hypothetical protein VGD64_15230 [Acidisarcina sp.]